MKPWRWVRAIILGLWAVEGLFLKLGWLVLTMWWSKLRAVRRYRCELERAGLPSSTVQELVAAYDVSLSDFVRLSWRTRAKRRKRK